MIPRANDTGLGDKCLPVLITVDVCDGSYDSGDRKDRFDSLIEALPLVYETLHELISPGCNGRLPVTWFVRADHQVRGVLGTTLGILKSNESFWDGVTKSGGEIGWHPHLFRKTGDRYNPVNDSVELARLASEIWRDMESEGSVEWEFQSCRMGEAVGSNELMCWLDSVGIRSDLTALPGRKRSDDQRKFDWSETLAIPYHPDPDNYQVAAGNEDGNLKIIEIPFTMAPVEAPYDVKDSPDQKFSRYIDLSYEPSRLIAGMNDIIDRVSYIVAVVHPIQAVGLKIPDGGLVKGGIGTLRENIKSIVECVKKSGRKPEYVTAKQFIHSISKH